MLTPKKIFILFTLFILHPLEYCCHLSASLLSQSADTGITHNCSFYSVSMHVGRKEGPLLVDTLLLLEHCEYKTTYISFYKELFDNSINYNFNDFSAMRNYLKNTVHSKYDIIIVPHHLLISTASHVSTF